MSGSTGAGGITAPSQETPPTGQSPVLSSRRSFLALSVERVPVGGSPRGKGACSPAQRGDHTEIPRPGPTRRLDSVRLGREDEARLALSGTVEVPAAGGGAISDGESHLGAPGWSRRTSAEGFNPVGSGSSRSGSTGSYPRVNGGSHPSAAISGDSVNLLSGDVAPSVPDRAPWSRAAGDGGLEEAQAATASRGHVVLSGPRRSLVTDHAPGVSLLGYGLGHRLVSTGSVASATSVTRALPWAPPLKPSDRSWIGVRSRSSGALQSSRLPEMEQNLSVFFPTATIDPMPSSTPVNEQPDWGATGSWAQQQRLGLAQVHVEGYFNNDPASGAILFIPTDLPKSTILYVLTASEGRDRLFKVIQYLLVIIICLLRRPGLFSPEIEPLMRSWSARLWRNVNTVRHGRSLFKLGRGIVNFFYLQSVCELLWRKHQEDLRAVRDAVVGRTRDALYTVTPDPVTRRMTAWLRFLRRSRRVLWPWRPQCALGTANAMGAHVDYLHESPADSDFDSPDSCEAGPAGAYRARPKDGGTAGKEDRPGRPLLGASRMDEKGPMLPCDAYMFCSRVEYVVHPEGLFSSSIADVDAASSGWTDGVRMESSKSFRTSGVAELQPSSSRAGVPLQPLRRQRLGGSQRHQLQADPSSPLGISATMEGGSRNRSFCLAPTDEPPLLRPFFVRDCRPQAWHGDHRGSLNSSMMVANNPSTPPMVPLRPESAVPTPSRSCHDTFRSGDLSPPSLQSTLPDRLALPHATSGVVSGIDSTECHPDSSAMPGRLRLLRPVGTMPGDDDNMRSDIGQRSPGDAPPSSSSAANGVLPLEPLPPPSPLVPASHGPPATHYLDLFSSYPRLSLGDVEGAAGVPPQSPASTTAKRQHQSHTSRVRGEEKAVDEAGHQVSSSTATTPLSSSSPLSSANGSSNGVPVAAGRLSEVDVADVGEAMRLPDHLLQPASTANAEMWRKGPLDFSTPLALALVARNIAAVGRRLLQDVLMLSAEHFMHLEGVELRRPGLQRLTCRLWFVCAVADFALNGYRLMSAGWYRYVAARQDTQRLCGCPSGDGVFDLLWRYGDFVGRRKVNLMFPPLDMDYGCPMSSAPTYLEAADPMYFIPACSKCGYLFMELSDTPSSAATAAAAAAGAPAGRRRSGHRHDVPLEGDTGSDGVASPVPSTEAMSVKLRWQQLYEDTGVTTIQTLGEFAASRPAGFLFIPWLVRKLFDYLWLLRTHENWTGTLLLQFRYLCELYLSSSYAFGGFEKGRRDASLEEILHLPAACAGFLSGVIALKRSIDSAPA